MTYRQEIATVVATGVMNELTAAELTAPLINELARILVATSNTSGTPIDDVVEIVRHELDTAVIAYRKDR